jgi:hypothetical protein
LNNSSSASLTDLFEELKLQLRSKDHAPKPFIRTQAVEIAQHYENIDRDLGIQNKRHFYRYKAILCKFICGYIIEKLIRAFDRSKPSKAFHRKCGFHAMSQNILDFRVMLPSKKLETVSPFQRDPMV